MSTLRKFYQRFVYRAHLVRQMQKRNDQTTIYHLRDAAKLVQLTINRLISPTFFDRQTIDQGEIMRGLREHVALAIANDKGAGIINSREVEALMAGAQLLEEGGSDGEDMARLLRDMAIGLQDKAIFSSIPRVSRVNDYYLHCADVVIAAYDQWIDRRAQLHGKIKDLRATGQSSGTLADVAEI